MKAAPNEPRGASPNFGKHQSWAYSSAEKAVYIFGGDGTSYQGVGSNSGAFHFGRIHLAVTPPVFDHFYPYYGIVGQPVPAGYDCCPFVYDSTRNCFWQMGGYYAASNQTWTGTPSRGGIWRYDPGTPWGTWTRFGTGRWPNGEPPYSDAEGMQAFYHPGRDAIIGVKLNYCWYYFPATGTAWYCRASSSYDLVGNYNALPYDPIRNEFFLLDAAQKLYAYDMNSFPTAEQAAADLATGYYQRQLTYRLVATMPYGFAGTAGQNPTVFVPLRRQLVIYYTNKIVLVNVDTGAITDGPTMPTELVQGGSWINSATYAPDLDVIAGAGKDSGKVYIYDWNDVPAWIPASGHAAAVSKNTPADPTVNPDPRGRVVYRGGTGYMPAGNYSGSVYAHGFGDLGTTLLWNGGDADYWGNELIAFDWKALTWYRLTDPCTSLTGFPYMRDTGYDGVHGLHASGQPSVPHAYDSTQYLPPSPTYPKGVFACVVRLYCYGPRSVDYSAYFDLNTRTWSLHLEAANPRKVLWDIDNAFSCYDTKRNRIWYGKAYSEYGVGYVDSSFSHHLVRCGGFQKGYATGAYDPVRDIWIVFDRSGPQFLQLSNPSAGWITPSLTGSTLPGTTTPGFDWAPELNCGYAYFGNDPQHVYKIEAPPVLTNAWRVTRFPISGATITSGSTLWSKWRWVSRFGAFYLIGDTSAPMYVYKP